MGNGPILIALPFLLRSLFERETGAAFSKTLIIFAAAGHLLYGIVAFCLLKGIADVPGIIYTILLIGFSILLLAAELYVFA